MWYNNAPWLFMHPVYPFKGRCKNALMWTSMYVCKMQVLATLKLQKCLLGACKVAPIYKGESSGACWTFVPYTYIFLYSVIPLRKWSALIYCQTLYNVFWWVIPSAILFSSQHNHLKKSMKWKLLSWTNENKVQCCKYLPARLTIKT